VDESSVHEVAEEKEAQHISSVEQQEKKKALSVLPRHTEVFKWPREEKFGNSC
jgi:hypothetical protein